MAIPTNGIQLVRISGAVFNQQLSASDYSEILAANRTAAELDAWANAAVAAEFKGKTTTDIAKAVLANVGLSSVAGLEAWVAGQLNAGGGFAKAGATLLTLLNDYSNMSTSDATYGASVATFNTKVANSQALSQTAGTSTGTYAAVSTTSASKVLTDASDAAAAAAAKAITDATAADAALTAAQTALTAATAKAALTDATALTAATTAATAASTAAAATKTAADAAVVTAQTALTNAITAGVVNDINTANANLLIAQARATTAATAATTAATAAATAKIASDAATADDVAASAAQTALNSAVTAASKAAADAITAAAASKAAALKTPAATDDTAADAAVTAAAARGAGAAKITADAAAAAAAAAKAAADAAAAKAAADAAVAADAAAAKAAADKLAIENAPKNFTLTTGTDVSTGGPGNDAYTATQLTFNAGDVIDGGAGTADTLTITDSGTAVWTLPTSASVSNFEIVKLKNVNTLSAGSEGTAEKATIVFKDLAASETVTLAGVRFTAGVSGATSAQVASAFTSGTITATSGAVAGGFLTDAATNVAANADTRAEVTALLLAGGYSVAAGANSSTVVATGSAVGNVSDLTAGGSATTGAKQVTTLTLANNSGNADNKLSFKVNGIAVTTAAGGATDATSLVTLAASVANNINGALGKQVAFTDGKSIVHIISDTPVTIGDYSTSGTSNTTTLTAALAPEKQTLTFATNPGSPTQAISLVINGVSYSTTGAANTAGDVRDKILAVINSVVPGVATASSTDAIILDGEGSNGIAISNISMGSTGLTPSATTLSRGVVAASAPVITVANGTAAVAATTGADVLDASKFVGATNIQNDVSTGAVTISNVASTQSVTINGNGAITNGATTVQSASTSTSSNVTVSGVTGGALTLSSAGGVGVQTATLTSSGDITNATVTPISKTNVLGGVALGGAATALNIVANTNLTTGGVTGFAGTTATITATGSGTALNLGTLENTTVRTVDASGFAGAVTATLNTNAALSFKGGSGNDVITTGAVLATGSVDAGAGTGDVLVVGTNLSHVNTATLGAKYTNFEAIRLNGTYDASLVPGITSVQLSGSTNTITNLSPAQTVVARADIGSSTLAPVSGTTNTLNMTMGQGTTTLAATNASTLTLNGYETLNVTTASGPTAAVGSDRTSTISAFTAANLTKVNLFGTSVALSNIATTLAVAVDGSALTGNGSLTTDAITGLTVAGNPVSGSSFKGSVVRDSFTLGTAVASTYDAGAGNDYFSATAAQIGDAVTDPTLIGGDGTDTINITSTLSLVDSDFKKLTSFEKLNLGATTAVSVSGLTTNTVAAFPTTLTVTGSTLANGATYGWESLAYDKNTSITLVTDGDLAGTDDNVTIVTGAGNDTVTVTAASAVATAGAGGTISVTTGVGVDTITVSTGTLTANTNQSVAITAGAGADVITVTTGTNATSAKGNVLFTIAAGDSNTTAYDVITGFKMSDIGGTGGKVSHQIDFAGTGAIATYAATAAAGFTAAQLTVAVSSAGLVTFAGTSAASITLDQAIAAVQSVVATSNGETAVFTYTTSGVTDTYVFNNNTTDSVVRLVGISAAALITTNDATTDNGIFIS